MIYFAQAMNADAIFGLAQWKVGSGLVALIVIVLLAMGQRGIKVLTSLHVTIWTLFISVILVFLGSWAQVNEGLWDAQTRWFKSWFIIREQGDGWLVPPIFPGGHLLGTILLVNLLAAHAKRFTWHFHKVGIQLTHIGIVMLLVGQFFTDELAVESTLSFREGETKQYTELSRNSELFFSTDTGDGKEQVVAIPEEMVEEKAAKQGEISHWQLPFTVKVLNYGVNGDVLERSIILEKFTQLTGALGMVEGKFGGGDLVALAKEAAESEGRAAVWREALRAVGERELTDLTAATERATKDAARTEKLRTELKTRFRDQMLEANARQGDEARYVAELLRAKQTVTEESLPKATTDGLGSRAVVIPRAKQKDNDARNLPYAIVELADHGKPIGRWLVQTLTVRPQQIEIGGKTWQIGMRFERIYLPYTMKLIKATHDVYQGTDTPKDYRSRVVIADAATGEKRETEIYMNQPLRYAGKTFYQSQMGNDQRNVKIKTSGLQVVQNPSWLTPYAGCMIVGLGLLWQFLWHLSKFFSKRMNLPAPEVSSPHALLPLAAVLFVLPDLWILGSATLHQFLPNLSFMGLNPVHNSGMTMTAIGCSLVLRLLIAWQVWRGRYLGFALVFLSVTTMLLVPFAIKYAADFKDIFWPLILAQTFTIVAIVIAILDRPKTAAATAQ